MGPLRGSHGVPGDLARRPREYGAAVPRLRRPLRLLPEERRREDFVTTGAEITSFLGLRRNIVLLLAALVAIGFGEELWLRFVPKYLEVLGAGTWGIGGGGAGRDPVGGGLALA